MQLETIFELLANYIFIGLKVSVLLTLMFLVIKIAPQVVSFILAFCGAIYNY